MPKALKSQFQGASCPAEPIICDGGMVCSWRGLSSTFAGESFGGRTAYFANNLLLSRFG
jgi:hypothetical protein